MAIDGKGRPTKQQGEQKKYLQSWLASISTYEKKFQDWEKRTTRITERYRDDRRHGDTTQARFNILWSNVQTLTPATFSKLPQPDVSRRFRDNDPVGRVASLILERALDFEISHYPDYRASLTQAVSDRFLGGRGTAWARYEPHITATKKQLPEDGEQITEDQDEPDEQLEYECAPIDYVHWRDFGHSIARTWEEVQRVWRRVYLTRDACVERFGEDIGDKIPLDSSPEDLQKNKMAESDSDCNRALVIEGWDKEKGVAVWISKSMGKILDQKDDPLNLSGFFPCPKPLYATLTNDSLIPIPDFTLYQDQARELDTLSAKIDGLVRALQVKGCYDASIPELQRLFTEGTNADMIPVTNWGAFSEKNGLQGAISLVDLDPIAAALREAYQAMDQIKNQVYEITGISDIVRGATAASETATAQQIKGRYASLRLKQYQDEVALFATDALRLKAQIMCGKFDPDTLLKISAADQLSEQDKALIPQAMALLFGQRLQNPDAMLGHYENPIRSFRIDIAADTLVQTDEEADRAARVDFLRSTGAFLKEATISGQQAPQLVPLLMQMLGFGVRGFKVGKTIEGAFDEAETKAKQIAAQPQPQKPNPEMARVQGEQQLQQARMQADQQRKALEDQRAAQEAQREAQLEAQRQQFDWMMRQRQAAEDATFARFEALLKAKTAVEVAEINQAATISAQQIGAAGQAAQ